MRVQCVGQSANTVWFIILIVLANSVKYTHTDAHMYCNCVFVTTNIGVCAANAGALISILMQMSYTLWTIGGGSQAK